MNVQLIINGKSFEASILPGETALTTLRKLGFHSIKFGDEHGLTGADTILLDGKPINAGMMLTAQAEGHEIATLEALGFTEETQKFLYDIQPERFGIVLSGIP